MVASGPRISSSNGTLVSRCQLNIDPKSNNHPIPALLPPPLLWWVSIAAALGGHKGHVACRVSVRVPRGGRRLKSRLEACGREVRRRGLDTTVAHAGGLGGAAAPPAATSVGGHRGAAM